MLFSLAIAPLSVMSMSYGASTSTSGPTLAIIPPWFDRDETLARAGLTEVAPVRALFGVLVEANPTINLATVSDPGIWALLDGRLIAAICGVDDV
ncbi:hypothetical protein [Celeribacter marinus]|uniref:hypothetical protein n=1 Tax=Celeribacter marinus TaxID=1397108 RepID=UPI003F6A8083